jgi:2-dehydro-3-deoxyphosphooctonate aldolase (KDO 8-P synthase)
MAAQYVDVLQIPAFRQTDLVVAAANTGKVVNLKRPIYEPRKHETCSAKGFGLYNQNVMVTDRGTMFGYQDMIVDFRGIPTMQQYASTVLDNPLVAAA